MSAAASSLPFCGWNAQEHSGDYGLKSTATKTPSTGNLRALCEQGIFEQLYQELSDDADLEHFAIDSTIIRAHPRAAGAPKGAPKKAAGRKHKPYVAVVAASLTRFTLRWMLWVTRYACS